MPESVEKVQLLTDTIEGLIEANHLYSLEKVVVISNLLDTILMEIEASEGRGKAIEVLNNLYNMSKDAIIERAT